MTNRSSHQGRPPDDDGLTTMTPDDADDPVWDQAMDWLLALHAAPGDAVLRRDLAAWRAADAAHDRAYVRAERVWRVTGGLAPAAPVITAPNPVVVDLAPRRRPVLAYAIVALLAACLVIAVLPWAMLRVEADYLTGTAERRQLTLADGTVVDLNADSAVAVDYTPERRDLVLLAGEAFVTVGTDIRPFRVRAKGMTVVDIGTAFDVGMADDSFAVAVEHGAVQVAYADGQQPVDARLGPGDRLRIDRATGATVRHSGPTAQIAAWRQGRLIVEDATIGEVVDRLRRHHRGMIVLRDEALAARRVTGVYDLADPVAALRTALRPHAGTVEEYTPYLLVVSRR